MICYYLNFHFQGQRVKYLQTKFQLKISFHRDSDETRVRAH